MPSLATCQALQCQPPSRLPGVSLLDNDTHVGRVRRRAECGYFEDRRPASNMDPYVVTGKIMHTCILPDCK